MNIHHRIFSALVWYATGINANIVPVQLSLVLHLHGPNLFVSDLKWIRGGESDVCSLRTNEGAHVGEGRARDAVESRDNVQER